MRALRRIYISALLVLLSAGAFYFIWVGFRDMGLPYSQDFGEGVTMWSSQQIVNLREAYHPLSSYPYAIVGYPPVFFIVSRMVGGFSGNLLGAGRLISLLSAIAVGICCGLIVWRALPRRIGARRRAFGLLVTAMLCYNLDSMRWAWLMRLDTLAILLTFIGLLLFYLSPLYAGFDYAAFFVFVLAVYTKQTMVTAPAVCLAMAAVVSWRRAARLLLFTMVLGLTPFAFLMVQTNGMFMADLLILRKNAFKLVNMLGMMSNNIATVAPLAALAVALPLLSLCRLLSRPDRLRSLRSGLVYSAGRRATLLFGLYFAASFVFSATAGKRGANINYFLEWNLAACVLAGFFIVRLVQRWDTRWTGGGIAALTIVLLWAVQGPDRLAHRIVYGNNSAAHTREFREVLSRVSALPDPVLSEDEAILVRLNKPVPAEMDTISLLADTGAWNQRAFVEMLDKGRFSGVVVTSSLSNRNCYTAEMQRAIESAYRLVWVYPDYRIYLPKSEGSRTASLFQPYS